MVAHPCAAYLFQLLSKRYNGWYPNLSPNPHSYGRSSQRETVVATSVVHTALCCPLTIMRTKELSSLELTFQEGSKKGVSLLQCSTVFDVALGEV